MRCTISEFTEVPREWPMKWKVELNSLSPVWWLRSTREANIASAAPSLKPESLMSLSANQSVTRTTPLCGFSAATPDRKFPLASLRDRSIHFPVCLSYSSTTPSPSARAISLPICRNASGACKLVFSCVGRIWPPNWKPCVSTVTTP